MNKIALAASAALVALALTGCGKSDSADELANPDNVEMPAEETMGTLDASAAPVADAAATEGADATAAATEAGAATAAASDPAA